MEMGAWKGASEDERRAASLGRPESSLYFSMPAAFAGAVAANRLIRTEPSKDATGESGASGGSGDAILVVDHRISNVNLRSSRARYETGALHVCVSARHIRGDTECGVSVDAGRNVRGRADKPCFGTSVG